MSSKKSKDEPEEDPYDVLAVRPDASDAQISKAYKKLALKLHPDKQANKSPAVIEAVAKKFHNVQQARAFLLDPEFQDARRKYDAKRASIQKRKQADAKRQESMNDRRKRQLDELKKQEAEAERDKKKRKHHSSSKRKNREEEELIEKLRGEGSKLRQQKAEKQAEAAAASVRKDARNDKQDRKQKERLLQNRQVRLKWSRKKMETSPSEHSLATLMSKYGTVEEVEMIGSKGNLALITFEFPSSCRPCVDDYKKSEEMRAFYVGKRKEEEEAKEAAAEREEDSAVAPRGNRRRDQESLYDHKLRQAEEREQLLRAMEVEETGGSRSTKEKQEERGSTADVTSHCVSVNFPSKYADLTPIQRLVKAEEEILGKLLSGDGLARLEELHVT